MTWKKEVISAARRLFTGNWRGVDLVSGNEVCGSLELEGHGAAVVRV